MGRSSAVPNSRPDLNRLELLARHLPTFEAANFTFGDWQPSWTDDLGVIHLGWYRFSPAAEAFLADVRSGGWVQPFDWMAWLETSRGKALFTDPAAIADASVDELQQLVTALVRSERFGDGTLASAYESGVLTAILRRASELAMAG
jgi:hypothetical protein